jgi:arylsulfatase A-like enzyme
VTARPGYDLRARFEKPSHRGSHGSLHRLHLMTPLLANHPLAAGPARTVDILPTVLDALGIRSPAEIDGRSLWPAAPRGEF